MTSTDFNVFANSIVNAANRALQELNDTNGLQWHVERLEFLTRMGCTYTLKQRTCRYKIKIGEQDYWIEGYGTVFDS